MRCGDFKLALSFISSSASPAFTTPFAIKKVNYALKEFTLSNFFIQNITEVLMCYSAVKCVESDTCPIRFTVCSNTNY